MQTTSRPAFQGTGTGPGPKGVAVLAGRVLFAPLFVLSGLSHFSLQTIARAASQGVPLASLAVPLSGIIAIIGSLCILLGYHTKFGAGPLSLENRHPL